MQLISINNPFINPFINPFLYPYKNFNNQPINNDKINFKRDQMSEDKEIIEGSLSETTKTKLKTK